MKEYKCDICGEPVEKSLGSIRDCKGIIPFKIPNKPKRNGLYAGLQLELKSNTLSDMCEACILKVVKRKLT